MRRDVLLAAGLGFFLLVVGLAVLVLEPFASDADTLEHVADPGETVDDRSEGPARRAAREARPADASRANDPGEAAAAGVAPHRPAGEVPLLHGRVVDASGRPVAGAALSIHDDVAMTEHTSLRGGRVAAAVSDERGVFSVGGLPAHARLILRAEHPEHRRADVAGLALGPRETREIEVRMLAGVPVRGVVKDETGAPVAGAEIVLIDAQAFGAAPADAVERSTVSDRDGAFELPHVSPGIKRVVARMSGLATDAIDPLVIPEGSAPAAVELVLSGGAAAIRGRVVDARGAGVAGARIDATRLMTGRGARRRFVPPTETGEDGSFVLAGLETGAHYTVRASKEGYVSGGRARVGSDGEVLPPPKGEPAPPPAILTAEAGDEIELALIPMTGISGRVVDAATGRPVTAFSLHVAPVPELSALAMQAGTRVVDPEGRFTLRSPLFEAARGAVHVLAVAPGYAGGRVEIDAEALRRDGERTGVEIRLTRGGSLAIRVLDPEGRPVPGAAVRALAVPENAPSVTALLPPLAIAGLGPAQRVATTDGDGRAAVGELLPGRHRVTVEHPGHAPLALEEIFTIRGEERVDAGAVRLTRGGRVSGVVLDADGMPVESALVRLAPIEGTDAAVRDVRTGLTGAYVFDHVRSGVFELAVVLVRGLPLAGGQGRASAARIVVTDDEPVTRDLRVP